MNSATNREVGASNSSSFTAVTLPENPCTAPWVRRSVAFESSDRSDGHMTPLPTASSTVPP